MLRQFLTQVINLLTREGALLDLLLTNNEDALNEVKGRLGYHNHGTRV